MCLECKPIEKKAQTDLLMFTQHANVVLHVALDVGSITHKYTRSC